MGAPPERVQVLRGMGDEVTGVGLPSTAWMIDAQDGPRPCGAIQSAFGLVLGLVWEGQRGLACPWGHSLESQTPRRGHQQDAGRWGHYESCPLEERVGPRWVGSRVRGVWRATVGADSPISLGLQLTSSETCSLPDRFLC